MLISFLDGCGTKPGILESEDLLLDRIYRKKHSKSSFGGFLRWMPYGESNSYFLFKELKKSLSIPKSSIFPFESKLNIDKNRSTLPVERFFESDAPKRTRTAVWALRGPRPRPLDDGGDFMTSLTHVSDVVYGGTKPPIPSGRDCIIAFSPRQLIGGGRIYGIISPLPSRWAGHILPGTGMLCPNLTRSRTDRCVPRTCRRGCRTG